MANIFFRRLATKFPELKNKLKKAGMEYEPEVFIQKTFLSSFYMATGAILSVFLILAKLEALNILLLIFIPFIYIVLFTYMMKFPDARISKKSKEISKEILFAGRHLVIELESGVPLYNAMVNISKNYPTIGQYFREITDKVNFGTDIETALTEAVEYIPSDNFRRILWQILNSIRTGSDISKSLDIVLEQVAREQNIEVNRYGRKLNPLAMFYMIIAVILPSLGVTMLIVLSSFVEFEINLTILLVIAFLLGFVQFMFYSMIKFSRPAIEF